MFRQQLVVVGVAALVFFSNLGGPRLWDEDEPKNSACALEMQQRGDWIVPSFNHDLRTDKPVLLYWLMMTAYGAFGVGEFAARFWSALLGVGTVLVTYHLGRLLFRPHVGLWSALAMATCLWSGVASRAATPDATLTFFTTLSLLFYVAGVSARWQGFPPLDAPAIAPLGFRAFLPARWSYFAGMYSAMAMAVLAKGPVGVLLPATCIGSFLVTIGCARSPAEAAVGGRWQQAWQSVRRGIATLGPAAWAMRPLTLAAIVLLIAGPWYAAVGLRTDGQWLSGFFLKHNVGRFMEPMEGHRGPIVFHLLAILAFFFPWSILLPLAVIRAVAATCRAGTDSAACLLMLCWAAVWLAVFSLAGTKLPNYTYPAYPALATIAGLLIARWIEQPQTVARWWLNSAWGALGVVGIGVVAGLWVALDRYLPAERPLAAMGLVLVAGAIVAALATHRARPQRAMLALAVCAFAFAWLLFAWAAPRVSRYENSASLIAEAHRRGLVSPRVATLGHWAPSLVFYAADRVERLTPEQACQFFQTAPQPLLVADAKDWQRCRAQLPGDAAVLARQPKFLRSGELVLIGRAPHAAGRESSTRR